MRTKIREKKSFLLSGALVSFFFRSAVLSRRGLFEENSCNSADDHKKQDVNILVKKRLLIFVFDSWGFIVKTMFYETHHELISKELDLIG